MIQHTPHLGRHIAAVHPPVATGDGTPAPQPLDFMGQLANSNAPADAVAHHYQAFGRQQVYEPASSQSFASLAKQYATQPTPQRLTLIQATLRELAGKITPLPYHSQEKPRFSDPDLHAVAALSYTLKQVSSVIDDGKLGLTPQSQAIHTLWDRFWESPESLNNQQRTFLVQTVVGMAAALHKSAGATGALAGQESLRGFGVTDSGPFPVVHVPKPDHRASQTMASAIRPNVTPPLHVHVQPTGLTALALPGGPQIVGKDTVENRRSLRTAHPGVPVDDGHRWEPTTPQPTQSNAQHIRDTVDTVGPDQTFEHVADPALPSHPATLPGNYMTIHGSHDSQVVLAIKSFIKRNHLSKATVEYQSAHKTVNALGDHHVVAQQSMVVDLGDDPDKTSIQKIWSLVNELKKDFDVRAEVHLHGDHAVPVPATQIYAHHHKDAAGTYLLRHSHFPSDNATPMWVHPKDAPPVTV